MSLKFGQIQPVVSMVTDRVMMGKMVSPLFLGCFSSVPFLYLQAIMTCMRAWTSLNFGLIRPQTAELAALESLKKSP